MKAEDTGLFVNTGYPFFNQYHYLYDDVNGQVGYRISAAIVRSSWRVGRGGHGVSLAWVAWLCLLQLRASCNGQP